MPYDQVKTAITICLTVLFSCRLAAQADIVFQHLNTANGLSYIGVTALCTDKKGNLWIGTGNGLNMFIGKSVEKYFASEYPALQNSNVVHLTCDRFNRIWILTAGGHVTMLDEKRQMHRVAIHNQEYIKILWILNSGVYGPILYTSKGNYFLNKSARWNTHDSLTVKHFDFLPVRGFSELNMKGRSRVFAYDDNYYLLVHQDAFIKIKYSNNTVERKYDYPGLRPLIKWERNSLLAFDQNTSEIVSINMNTEEVSYLFRGLKDQYGREAKGRFNFAIRSHGDKYVFTTQDNGICIFDKSDSSLYSYRHHYADPSSLGTDNCSMLAADPEGWVFIATPPDGVSYFNTRETIKSKLLFTNNKGKGYDGLISGMSTTDNRTYYLGTEDGIIEWNRINNLTRFIDLKDKNGALLTDEIASITHDNMGNTWAAGLEMGLVVLDKNKNTRKHFYYDKDNEASLKVRRISRVVRGPDEYIWVCGTGGISRINPVNFHVDNLQNTPLSALDTMHVVPIIFRDKNNLWIATSVYGLYHYDLTAKKLTEIESFRPFKHYGILDFALEDQGNIYVGSKAGLFILYKSGSVKWLTQKDGLLIDRVEAVIRDKQNRLWLGNDIGLSCYSPSDSGLRTFDVRYGLSIYGFRVGSYFKMSNGEFFFGTPHGLQYFHPDSLYNKKIRLNVSVTKVETRKFTSGVSGSELYSLKSNDNQVSFHFGTVDYSPHLRTYYQYKLEDLDKDWIEVVDQNSVRYNSLPPGNYQFKLRVSNDNINWQDSENIISVHVAAPFYGTWWFRMIVLALGLGVIWYVINFYRKKQMQQSEELETQMVINFFASRINSYQKTEEILWDVVRNCISKLKFEDCVIYLLDEDRNVLVQKAAYGPKMARDYKIHQPIEILVGKGIVGTVAKTGRAELINNTELDERYIVDDARRYSEVAVPLIADDKVIGVIDSEHSKKNFFTQRHLTILSTIAVLCANQVQRSRAEEEKQKAKIEALEDNQKVTESRVQSLRLQMNPHFLFNALNSIQQMILANEEMVATKYLSKFSKLLRTVLVHSDKEFITLTEELEILRLYIDLESIRFKSSFNYSIECDEDMDTDEIKLPTLLIQPFVENAIWHGLMHKEGERLLSLKFSESEDSLVCTIEDNGVGRKRSAEIKMVQGHDKKHTSKGIQVSKERLQALNNTSGDNSLRIYDLEDEYGNATGTRVRINFKIKTTSHAESIID